MVGRLQVGFSNFGVAIKVSQDVYLASSPQLFQERAVTQPNPQLHHPANRGQERGKHRRPFDSSCRQQCQTALTQKEEITSSKQPSVVEIVPRCWMKEYFCLLPSLHQDVPCEFPITDSCCSTLSWHRNHTACETGRSLLQGWLIVGGLHVNKKPQEASVTHFQALLSFLLV